MAYAGICLTDDLQAAQRPVLLAAEPAGDLDVHVVEPGGDQRGADGVAAALRRRQRGAGRHLRAGLRADGDDPAADASPSARCRARPSSAVREEIGNTVTISTGAAGATHTLQPGDVVTIAGVANAGYNGTFTVTPVPTHAGVHRTRTRPPGSRRSAAARSRSTRPGLTRVGQHGHGQHRRRRTAARSATSSTIAGAGVAGYNGTLDDHRRADAAARSSTRTRPPASPNSGGGTMTFISPFNLRVGGTNDSVADQQRQLHERGLTAAFNAIAGFAGTATVTGAASTGLHA